VWLEHDRGEHFDPVLDELPVTRVLAILLVAPEARCSPSSASGRSAVGCTGTDRDESLGYIPR
jgi:hypothetical protein